MNTRLISGGRIRFTENPELVARVVQIKRRQIEDAGFYVSRPAVAPPHLSA